MLAMTKIEMTKGEEKMKDNENSGWGVFGKLVAGTALLGGIGTGIYFGCKTIYDNGHAAGFGKASYALEKKCDVSQKGLKEDFAASQKRLEDEGRLLPENCFRFSRDGVGNISSSEFSTYTLSTYGSCSGLEITMPVANDYTKLKAATYSNPIVPLDVVLGKTKVTVSNTAPYAIVQRYDSGWTKVE
ncbi:MAG: hypothetical protein AABX82_09585 [Nanoarchaeota archaeon]